jgi:hypothetical protein
LALNGACVVRVERHIVIFSIIVRRCSHPPGIPQLLLIQRPPESLGDLAQATSAAAETVSGAMVFVTNTSGEVEKLDMNHPAG